MLDKIIFKKTGDSIQIKEIASTRREDPVIAQKVDEEWEMKMREAKGKLIPLYDAEIYRYEDFDENSLVLKLSTVPYRFLKGMKQVSSEIQKLGYAYYPLGIFTSLMILTEDGYYVFGRRGKTVSANKVDCIGGVLSKSERKIQSVQDIVDSVLTELNEETYLERAEIKEIDWRAIFLTDTLKVCFLFCVSVSKNKEAMLHNFETNVMKDTKREMEDLFFVEKQNIDSFLNNLGGYKKTIAEIIKKT